MKIGFALEPIKGLPLNLIIQLMKGTLIEHFEFNWRIIPRVERILMTLGKTTTTFHLPIFNRDKFDYSSDNKDYEIQMQEIVSFINEKKSDLNMK
ncbi:MAG: hypothetical protein ACFFDW_15050 [Candidatus Thorarchaeota archaeon]